MTDDRFHNVTRQALVSVAAVVFVVPSSVGTGRQRRAKERPEHGGEGQVVPTSPPEGAGVTLLTAGPRAETQCGSGTGAPIGHGKGLSLHTTAERQD